MKKIELQSRGWCCGIAGKVATSNTDNPIQVLVQDPDILLPIQLPNAPAKAAVYSTQGLVPHGEQDSMSDQAVTLLFSIEDFYILQ